MVSKKFYISYLSLILPYLVFSVQFTINTQQDRKPISPYIYGTNQDREGVKNTARRFGGNRTTGYNWENNASNAGSDWYHNSDYFIPSDMGIPQSEWTIPGRCLTFFHEKSLQNGAASGITLQLAGYVAKDTNGPVSEAETAPSARWCEVRFRKNAPFSYPPDLSDNYVYLDECVDFLIDTFGQANTSTGIKVYMLDNEPDLWRHTHPRIHPSSTTCRELIWKSTTVASMVKDLDPYALIFGYASYGFKGYLDLQDAPDWNQVKGQNHRWFIDWYLEQMRIHSQQQGRRLLDALQVHWYPEAQGAGIRISFEDGSDTTRELLIARMQAPRTLWDPTYKSSQKGTITAGETSWINQWFPEYLPILPNLKQAIDQFYPGTKLAITEYSYGGEKNISGGIALADVLGIFAKYEVFWASMWGGDGPYTRAAFNIYLNYNGNGAKFGDTLVYAQTDDVEKTSVYASIFGNDESKLHIIAINKDLDNNISVTFNITSNYSYNYAEVWGFDSTSPSIIQRTPITNITNNTFSYTLPRSSVLHFVLTGVQQTNLPPSTPLKPQGPQDDIYIGPIYTFTTFSTDPNQDMIYYVFDWGDGTISTSTLLFSGATCYMTHVFSSSGTYNIKVKAVDSKGAESGWSEVLVVNVLDLVIEQLPKLVIYDGETSTTNFAYGGGWAAPSGSTIQEVTENYKSPNHSLKLNLTINNYWGGAGYNWAGWWRQNMILDLTKFEQLECYLYIATFPANARLTFHLKDSGNVMGREVVVNNYLPANYLNKWVLVRIPLDEFFSIEVSTADRSRVWELQIGVTGVQTGTALLYFDDFGFIYPASQQDAPPGVSIVSPANGSVVSGIVNIRVNATDDKGISKVLFYINDICVSTDTTSPYSYSWNTASYLDGIYSIKVVAYDTSNQTNQAQISVSVRNQIQQDNPPQITILSPLANSTVSSTVTISVLVSDDTGISKVLFYINDICVSTDTTLPYQYVWNTLQFQNGSYTIKVIAFDTSNQTSSSQINVNVNNVSGDLPPQLVGINGIEGELSGEVLISLDIQDDRGIQRVEIYLDDVLINTLTSSPYVFTLNTRNYSDGEHVLKVVVYDNSNQTTQQIYPITVNNTQQPQTLHIKKFYVFSPNNDGINDKVEFGDAENIEIYDLRGTKVLEAKKLDSSTKLNCGAYIFKLKLKNGTITTGIISVIK
ncbi:MAG: glycoside hydrolase family 44 protein [Candidatus Kryptonium sp.]